jgi:D-lactate dehydrogenase
MINKEAIKKMKKGVVLIDNARGELCDVDALIEGMETEKIGALFMDAFPGETGIIHVPHNEDIVRTEGMPWFKLKYLRSFVNFVHTPHMAFFTEEAAASMAKCGVDSIREILTDGKSSHEIPE